MKTIEQINKTTVKVDGVLYTKSSNLVYFISAKEDEFNLGSIVQRRRKELNLTQSFISEKYGIPLQQIYRFENSKGKIPFEKVVKILEDFQLLVGVV